MLQTNPMTMYRRAPMRRTRTHFCNDFFGVALTLYLGSYLMLAI
jgi:hypothetical protein